MAEMSTLTSKNEDILLKNAINNNNERNLNDEI